MTFAEILSAVYADMNLTASPASGAVTRIKGYVNQGVRAILREPGLGRLADSDTPMTLTSVASQARYVLPESVARIHAVTERTNDRSLAAQDLSWYRQVEADPASMTGTPEWYIPIGPVAVAVQPVDASSIFVKSSSASDTTQTVFIEVLITSGYRRTASVVLTGTTALSLSAAITTGEVIEDFYMSAAAVGTVTLHEDSGLGAELARITIGQTRPHYFGLYLYPTPAAAVAYTVDYRRTLIDLVNSTDEPPLPDEYHSLLIAYARMREYEKTDDQRHVYAEQEYRLGLSRLKFSTQSGPDELPVSGGRLVGRSRFGAYYPADWYSRG